MPSPMRAMAWVIGTLVNMHMMVVILVKFELVNYPEIIILGLIYVAFGVWTADRVFRRVSRDSRLKALLKIRQNFVEAYCPYPYTSIFVFILEVLAI